MKPLYGYGMLVGSFIFVGTLIAGCATSTDKSRIQCGNDYSCLSDMAFKYRQQADQLSALAERYEIEAGAMTGKDAETAKHKHDLAQAYWSEAQQADELAQEYRRQLPHNMAH